MSASVKSVDSRRVLLGLAFASLAMLSFVAAGLLANHVVDRGAPPVVVAFYEALFGLLFTLGIRARSLRGARPPGRAALAWMLSAGALFALAAASFYTALARLDFSVAAPITGATPPGFVPVRARDAARLRAPDAEGSPRRRAGRRWRRRRRRR